MERHEILELMRKLKLAGMRAAFDEVLTTGLKRQHSLQQIIGELLQAEIAEKQARCPTARISEICQLSQRWLQEICEFGGALSQNCCNCGTGCQSIKRVLRHVGNQN